MVTNAEHSTRSPAIDWVEFRKVIGGPLRDIATRFSYFLGGWWPHNALVIFTRECTGRPRKIAGVPEIADRITIDELETVKRSIAVGEVLDAVRTVGGTQRRICAVLDETDTLLLFVPRLAVPDLSDCAAIAAIFGIVATSIRHQVVQASPDYLAESRAASNERARTITELTDRYQATLAAILSTLRSNELDDRRSRIIASETASAALISLRTASDADRVLSEETVTTAFSRLQAELDPLLDVKTDYVAPPTDGRPLPGEVAHGARALVRSIVLTLGAQPSLDRLLIRWDCDGMNLLIEVRDRGSGTIDNTTLARQLSGRLRTLRGQVDIESIPGWGTQVALSIPLDPPVAKPDEQLLAALNSREFEVLGQLALGKRNRAIADELGISQSTIKFHVAGILKKFGVASRGEAAAIGIRAGILPD